MCCVLANPRDTHVSPPSVLRYTPVPYVISSRGFPSPLPTQITFGSLGATVMAPTLDRSVLPSVMFSHVCPALVVFQTPPFTAPK